MSRSVRWFLAVGVAASLTHLGVLTLLARHWPPEGANVAAFGVAFGVSYTGHRWLSFAHLNQRSVAASLWRFWLAALMGLAVNEAVFVALVRGVGAPLVAGWFVASGVVAVLSYGLSRYWVFRAPAP